jgi:hypothetical protein
MKNIIFMNFLDLRFLVNHDFVEKHIQYVTEFLTASQIPIFKMDVTNYWSPLITCGIIYFMDVPNLYIFKKKYYFNIFQKALWHVVLFVQAISTVWFYSHCWIFGKLTFLSIGWPFLNRIATIYNTKLR